MQDSETIFDVNIIPEGMLQVCFPVYSYEVDIRREATSETIARYLQEAAWRHAEALDLGFGDLNDEGLFWVLSRLSVRIHKAPLWGDKVYVRTWPRGAGGLLALRDFEMFSEAGELLVSAGSGWLILDRSNHRPRRPDAYLSRIAVMPQYRAQPHDPAKITLVEDSASCSEISVRYSDIDMNGHVNNTRYVGWISDLFGKEQHENTSIESFQVNYLAECSWGDLIKAAVGKTEQGYSLKLTRDRDGVEVMRATVTFR